MASSEVQRIWNDAVADFEASTSTKLDSLPVVSSAIDIVGALQIQETKFGVFRNSTSKVDKIRSAVKQGLHFVDQISKILASALSSVSLVDMNHRYGTDTLDFVELRTSFRYLRCRWLSCAGNKDTSEPVTAV